MKRSIDAPSALRSLGMSEFIFDRDDRVVPEETRAWRTGSSR